MLASWPGSHVRFLTLVLGLALLCLRRTCEPAVTVGRLSLLVRVSYKTSTLRSLMSYAASRFTALSGY